MVTMNIFVYAMIICTALAAENRLNSLRTLQDFTNICMLGTNHKPVPSAEKNLHGLCSGWSKRSCCTENSTKGLHSQEQPWYRFSYDHCGRKMSAKCRDHFLRDLCFYECSPNVGPWLVKVNMRIRSERFYKVPLCNHSCNAWWEACKDDLTCVANWNLDFNWTSGSNMCPRGRSCRPFHEIYSSATDFCEKVWDGSWSVINDDKPCMIISGEKFQHNTMVQFYYATHLVAKLSASSWGLDRMLTCSVVALGFVRNLW